MKAFILRCSVWLFTLFFIFAKIEIYLPVKIKNPTKIGFIIFSKLIICRINFSDKLLP